MFQNRGERMNLLIGSGVTALVLHGAFDLFTWSRNGSCFPLWSSVSTIQPS
jgi:hypothetical protein